MTPLIAFLLFWQPQPASIAGVVKDESTGKPLNGVTLTAFLTSPSADGVTGVIGSTRTTASTDGQGAFRLSGLAPGAWRVTAAAAGEFRNSVNRLVRLKEGEKFEGLELLLPASASISGRVLDENKEPVPGVQVAALSQEYYLGQVRYVFKALAVADDQGEYTIERLRPGRAYVVMARRVERVLPVLAEAPENPELRKRVAVQTFYPGSPSMETAERLRLGAGERREAVDIVLRRAAAQCIEGVGELASGPGQVRFGIDAEQPAPGTSSEGGFFMMAPGAVTGADGRFRICGVTPGEYVLSVSPSGSNAAPQYGQMPVSVGDRDVRGLRLVASAGVPLKARIQWHGPPPEKAEEIKGSLNLSPLRRAPFRGESTSAPITAQGEVELAALIPDEYGIRVNFPAALAYVREIRYGDRDILRRPFVFGGALAAGELTIVLGSDGGTVAARVVDKDEKAVAGAWVHLLPKDLQGPADLQAALQSGDTDQDGGYTVRGVRPGKYLVLATAGPANASVEVIRALWNLREKAKEIEIMPRGSATVSVLVEALRPE